MLSDAASAVAASMPRSEGLALGGRQSAGDGAGLRARVELGGSPAVPGDDAAVGVVGLAQRVELLRGGGGDVPGQGEALADDEVAGGPDVEAAELEQQEHFGRPPPDPPDRGEAGRDLLVALPGEAPGVEHDGAVEDLGGQVLHRERLVT